MFCYFGTIPDCDRQTGRLTERHDDSIYRASIASHGTNGHVTPNMPLGGSVCHPIADMFIYPTSMQNLMTLSSAVPET